MIYIQIRQYIRSLASSDNDRSDTVPPNANPGRPLKRVQIIDIPALHPIAMDKDWSNADSIHSYLPGEFTSRITNVHDKSKKVYDVLRSFREGSNIKKNDLTEMSVAELLRDPHYISKIEELYYSLKNALLPCRELLLPYTTNRKERLNELLPRITELYNIDRDKKPSYRLFRGTSDNGIMRYPFAFELLAAPLKNLKENDTEFIGAINYAVSPNGIRLEGIYDVNDSEYYYAENMNDILKQCGFHKHSQKKSRLPCIIIGNLITPRRDPHGQDKSRIDIQPFAETIVRAVKKLASDIQTLHSAGYIIRPKDEDYRNARQKKINRKVSTKELLRQFLIKERGLPNV
jgi:hypothetical protein